MWPFFLIAATATAGVGVYVLMRKGILGDRVVLYTSAFPEARRIVEELLGGWHAYPADTPADVISAVSRHGSIARLVWIGHGAPTWFFNSQYGVRLANLDRIAAAIGPRLAPGAVVGLAGCAAARGPGEAGEWAVDAFEDGGADSFAGLLRDTLVGNTWAPFGEVRSHSVGGHVTYNPSARYFPIKRSAFGRPGRSLMRERGETDWRRWRDSFTGGDAEQWMLGLD